MRYGSLQTRILNVLSDARPIPAHLIATRIAARFGDKPSPQSIWGCCKSLQRRGDIVRVGRSYALKRTAPDVLAKAADLDELKRELRAARVAKGQAIARWNEASAAWAAATRSGSTSPETPSAA